MNQKPKILELSSIDITLYRFVLPLMRELRKEGFEIVAAAKDTGYLGHIQNEGFLTVSLPMTRNLNPFSVLKAVIKVYKLLKQERINIIHVHTPIASFIGRIAAALAGVKTKVYTVHGFRLDNKLFYLIEKFMASYFTDFIFTVNSEDMNMAIENNFIHKDKIMNLNSVGIDINRFDPRKITKEERINLRQSLNLMEDDIVIGYVGRIVRIKGVLDLLSSYLQVKKHIRCKLLLVGPWKNLDERKDNRIINEIKDFIKDNNLQQEVILTGAREDIPQLLSIMDVFVLPSYWEGMPISLMEAMAMERPVIATDIRGTREEVDSISGILYKPKDINSLSEHIIYLIKNRGIAEKMGKNARRRVIENFSQQKVISKQIKVFKSLIKAKNYELPTTNNELKPKVGDH